MSDENKMFNKPKQPSILYADDGAVILSWNGKKARLMISIEVNPKESGWHFIEKIEEGGRIECGELTTLDATTLRKWLNEVDE